MTEDQLPSIDEQGFAVRSVAPAMSRGLSQVMFNYLPERTFDYDRGACIGKVFELRLQEVKGIDVHRLIASIRRYVERWGDRVDDLDLTKPHLLLFARPTRVLFNLFPLTFQCSCGRIKTFEKEQAFVRAGGVGACVACGPNVRFEQIYHILVHECGRISGLFPRRCPKCHRIEHIALDLRGSQRARDFRWLCKACGEVVGPVQRPCKNCAGAADDAEGQGGSSSHMMRVIPHRANQAFYAHHITVLNLPTELTAVLQGHPLRDKILATAVVEERYDELASLISAAGGAPAAEEASAAGDLAELLALAGEGERAELAKQVARFKELRKEKARREADAVASSTASITEGGWLEALEYLNVHTLQRVDRAKLRAEIESAHPGRGVVVDRLERAAARVGIADVQLVQDFPVVSAVFGYTRVSFEPESLLSGGRVLTRFQGFQTPFSGPSEQRRRRPIFVDDASTEALLFKISPQAIVRWLQRRGHVAPAEAGLSDRAARAWLLAELQSPDAFVTFKGIPIPTRDVFTLVHTFAHLVIRVLSRISGVERTGLAEYLFPRIGAFAVYNTKASSNLGGLNTVFAESQQELLETIERDVFVRTCVYDPVCDLEWRSTCHACTHLSEMSCKHYNRGLSRRILFGAEHAGPNAGFFATL